tara:strand:- start:1121 stop:1441 length:321 start_codon:yes stop_codon:yes gene_type:complete
MIGKGDKARPLKVPHKVYGARYDAIFGKGNKEVLYNSNGSIVEMCGCVEAKVLDTGHYCVENSDTLYVNEKSPFAEWLMRCPVEFCEDYTDNHGTRAGYTFWIEED